MVITYRKFYGRARSGQSIFGLSSDVIDALIWAYSRHITQRCSESCMEEENETFETVVKGCGVIIVNHP